MAYRELYPRPGAAPAAPKIVVAPADVDVSPQVSIHMPRSPYFTYYALYRAGMAVQDFLKVYMQSTLIDKLRAELPEIANWPMDLCYDAKLLSPASLAESVLHRIGVQYRFLIDAWKAGLGAGMGASYAAEIEQFMNPGQLLYAYSTLQYQASVVPRMRRHWMSQYTPTIPNTTMAYNLLLRGKINEAEFNTYASYDGWDSEGIGFLKEAWKSYPTPWVAFRLLMRNAITKEEFSKYITADGWPADWADKLGVLYESIPTPREAFFLWSKGQLTEDQRDAVYTAGGYKEEWHSRITDNWYYTPSIYDLTRIADYVELDQIWALDMMKRRGVKDRDRAKIWEMLEIRPLREEIRNLTDKALYCRQHGYWSPDKLSAYWAEMKIKPKERELLNEYGTLLYNVEVLEEQIEILRWRFRTAAISEKEFHDTLLELDIDTVKADLIVDLEKAKGYFGYIYPGAS